MIRIRQILDPHSPSNQNAIVQVQDIYDLRVEDLINGIIPIIHVLHHILVAVKPNE